LNERFEQYINGKRENLHSNFTLRLKKILWEARSTPTLVLDQVKTNKTKSATRFNVPQILHSFGHLREFNDILVSLLFFYFTQLFDQRRLNLKCCVFTSGL
jgi:hypothetical protein